MTKIIGHRGAAGHAPENTLASFEAALAAGLDEIELDVRVTKDGVPVINHDPCLRGRSGRPLPTARIADRTLAELRHWRSDLATLDEAVLLVNRQRPIIIEVKPKVSTNEIIAALKLYLAKGWQPTDFRLASFSQRTLRALHTALPAIEPIVLEHFSALWATHRARQVKAQRLTFNHHNLWWGLISSLSRRGYHVAAYTLNSPRKTERWAKHGLYAVVTDYPERFLRI